MPIVPPSREERPLFLYGPLLFIAAHFAFLMCYFAPAICTPDATSYFTQAMTLAKAGTTYVLRESPVQYIGPHYDPARQGRYYCKHAPGLGVLLAVPYRLFGPRATFWVNPLLASLSLLGLFFLGRAWCGQRYAPAAVALMAVNPFLNEHAQFGDAHVAVGFLLIWSLCLLTALRRRPSLWAGLAAGLLAGMIPVVRYPEVVYLPALVGFALSGRQQDRADRRALWAAAVGMAVPILLLALRNQSAYGAFWRTGYATAHEQSAFSLFYFLRNSPRFLQKLLGEGAGLTFTLGAAGIILMCGRRSARRTGLLCAGIILPTTVVYMSYYWPPDPQSMRFLLPTFFLYALASVWLLRLVAQRCGLRVGALTGALLVLQAWWGLPQSVMAMSMLQRQTMGLARTADVLQETVPGGSLLIAPESVNQYLSSFGDWRLADTSALQPRRRVPPFMPGGGGPAGEEGMMPGPGPFRPDLPEEMGPPMGQGQPSVRESRLEPSLFAAFRREVWSWAGGRRVYWLMSSTDLCDYYRALLPRGESFRIVASVSSDEGPRHPRGPAVREQQFVVEWVRDGRHPAAPARHGV